MSLLSSRLHFSPREVFLIKCSRFSSLSASIFCTCTVPRIQCAAGFCSAVRTYIIARYSQKLMEGSLTCPAPVVRIVPHMDTLPAQPSSSSLGWICLFNSQYSALKVFSSLRPSSSPNLKLHLKKVISFLRVLRNEHVGLSQDKTHW